MKRKILAALLSACLFVGLAVPAFAEGAESPTADPAEPMFKSPLTCTGSAR